MYWNPGDPFKPIEPLTITARSARITSFASQHFKKIFPRDFF
jgi:hypothetical protein